MRKKVLILAAIIFTSVFCAAISSMDTQAIGVADIGRITDKAKIADLKKCHGYFADSIDILKLNKPSDIVADPGAILALPNGTTNSDGLFNCKTLMNNYMNYSLSDNASKANFLKSMGYTPDTQTSGNEMTCKTMTFTRGAGNDAGTDNDGNGSQNKLTICVSGSQGMVSSLNITRNDLGNIAGATFNNFAAGDVLELDFDGNGTPDAQISYSNVKVDDFFSELESTLKDHQNSFRDAYDNTLFFGSFAGDPNAALENNDDAEVDNIYKKGPLVTNMPTVFTEDERLGLLVYYFRKYGEIACYWQEGATQLTIGGNEYYVTKKMDAPSTFYVVNGTSWFGEESWDGIIGELNGKDITGVPDCTDNTTPPGLTDGTGSGSNGDEDDGPCFDGGVGALGWIICPIIKLLRQTTENLYDYVITPFLEIDVGAFDTGSALFKGWQTFQSFANIIFVIVLLLVILSQVTGYGIDNYGIKRMLPKIIIGAVLVNLSFIICQLLVDASNIVGFSLENMFDGLARDAMNTAGGATGSAGTAVGATVISAAVGIGGAAAAIYTAEIWLPVIILPLILGIISIIISCLFMFIILGARRAAAVILVVISPLAFVCYMLPNTKKLFDRWVSAFKAVLLVFPICGLLMGGGAFAGAILWNVAGDFFLGQLLAALITVIPFFFIPRILKASLSAVGNIGAMLSNAGSGLSRGLGGIAKGAVGNSDWYNNMQSNRKDVLEERNRNREQARAQRIVDRLKARGGKDDENLTEAQKRRKYIAQAKLNKLQREDVEAEAGLEPISREVELAQAQAKRRQESVSAREDQIRLSPQANDLKALQNQLTAAITGNDEYGIEALQNVLSTKGDKGREAVHQAMVKAEESGSDISKEARQTYSSNIVNGKFANEYKNNSRSTFDYATANTGETAGGNMAQFYGGSVDSLTQQKMVDMDEGELKRVLGKMESGTMTDENYATVQRIARGALGNDKLQQSLKTSQRNLLNDIARRPAQRTTSVDIQHDNANTSGPDTSNAGDSTA